MQEDWKMRFITKTQRLFVPQSKRNLSTETSNHPKHLQFCINTYGITEKVLFVNYMTWNGEKNFKLLTVCLKITQMRLSLSTSFLNYANKQTNNSIRDRSNCNITSGLDYGIEHSGAKFKTECITFHFKILVRKFLESWYLKVVIWMNDYFW